MNFFVIVIISKMDVYRHIISRGLGAKFTSKKMAAGNTFKRPYDLVETLGQKVEGVMKNAVNVAEDMQVIGNLEGWVGPKKGTSIRCTCIECRKKENGMASKWTKLSSTY